MSLFNEILQWLAIALLATPNVVRIVRDFKEEDE